MNFTININCLLNNICNSVKYNTVMSVGAHPYGRRQAAAVNDDRPFLIRANELYETVIVYTYLLVSSI